MNLLTDTPIEIINKKKKHLIKKNLNLLKQFNDLSTHFNNTYSTQNNYNLLLKIVKKMRIIYGYILKIYFNSLKKENYSDNDFYILSILDTTQNNIRTIIKNAENIIINIKNNNGTESDLNQLKDNRVLEESEPRVSMANENHHIYFKDNIDNNINVILPIIILFYNNTCIYCKQFKPIWKALKSIIDKNKINIVQTDNNIVMSKYNVNSIPTIKMIYNNNIYNYDNNRDINSIIYFIESILKSKISTL